MSFVYPFLLGGLVLVGVPVLLHLIMRQKPKHLMFPAMRFILQRHRTNQRKLQLRHLLLLMLRMLLIAVVCLALARPKVFSERLNLSGDRPVAAVMIFDTSFSMEYAAGNRLRLDEAKRRGKELLETLPDGSQAAILDSAELSEDWEPSLSRALERINSLQLRPANAAVTSQMARAYDLLAKLDQENSAGEAPLPFLYIFSDRTQACWDPSHVDNLRRLRDRFQESEPDRRPVAVFVDVGSDTPANLSIVKLELPRQAVPANATVVIRAYASATGTPCDQEIICRIDGETNGEHKPVKLEAGQSQVISFERRGLSQGFHQVEIGFATTDAMPFDNVRFATFEVRGSRQVLVITDAVEDAKIWKAALGTGEAFACNVKSTADARKFGPEDLAPYQGICLLNVSRPDAELWEKLWTYVQKGGGLAVIPGGEKMRVDAYNTGEAQRLLPGRLEKIVTAAEPGAIWNIENYRHPLLAPFRDWSMNENVDFLQKGLEPAAARYWQVAPRRPEMDVIVRYGGKEAPAALMENRFDRKQVRGRTLLFTTALDDRHIQSARDNPAWNNYVQLSSFYLVLAHKAVGYLAGDAEDVNFNFWSGQRVSIRLPVQPRFSSYALQGPPGLETADAIVQRAEKQDDLSIRQAVAPGNYKLIGGDGKRAGAFSINVPPDECSLARVPAEQIEALLGPGSLLPLDTKMTMQSALQGHWAQPLDLMPWLMMLLLLALAAENLLANKFYRQERDTSEPGSKDVGPGAAQEAEMQTDASRSPA